MAIASWSGNNCIWNRIPISHLFSIQIGVFLLLSVVLDQIPNVSSHGRLMNPPARNTLWRFGYPNPINYNDNELFCGGQSVLWEINGGKCGICGDAWNLPVPRPHEDGGEFGNGIIVRQYSAGQDIDIDVDLTSNHLGHFTIKLCERNGKGQKLTHKCLNKNKLMFVSKNGTLFPHFEIASVATLMRGGPYHLTVRLPPDLTCTNCVLQWTYKTGNTWGLCQDGSGAMGCGPQEMFVNCADVAIIPSLVSSESNFIDANSILQSYRKNQHKNNHHLKYQRILAANGEYKMTPVVVKTQVCVATEVFSQVKGMDLWCQRNCVKYPIGDPRKETNCPTNRCKCLSNCDPIPPYNSLVESKQFCLQKCLVFPSKCPRNKCQCY